MKNIIFVLIFLASSIILQAQDKSGSERAPVYKLIFNYGISAINPEDINEHISISNALFGSSAHTIKSAPEISATFVMRPIQNDNIFIIRASYISIERSFNISVPETDINAAIVGRTTGTIKETYTVYPLSVGAGLASSNYYNQIQIEFIFGLGYIEENGIYTTSTGQRTGYMRSLFSPAYGFRLAGNTTIQISDNFGINLELAYRYLNFREYADETSTNTSDITFSYTGVQALIGLAITF
jgi:hypothetical protein